MGRDEGQPPNSARTPSACRGRPLGETTGRPAKPAETRDSFLFLMLPTEESSLLSTTHER